MSLNTKNYLPKFECNDKINYLSPDGNSFEGKIIKLFDDLGYYYTIEVNVKDKLIRKDKVHFSDLYLIGK